MCKFIRFNKNNPEMSKYISRVQICYNRYSKYLQDDFSHFEGDILSYIKSTPFFWIILSYKRDFKGFVLLDNFVGNKETNYSAELTTCFEPDAWGAYTRYCAKIFLKKAFDEFGLYKIKALVYPQNHRTSVLLKSSGFKYESTLKNETLRNNRPQDIDVYSLYRMYYYKEIIDKI